MHLGQASMLGHVEIVKLLLDKGTNVYSKANEGITPLQVASEKRNFEKNLQDSIMNIYKANCEGK